MFTECEICGILVMNLKRCFERKKRILLIHVLDKAGFINNFHHTVLGFATVKHTAFKIQNMFHIQFSCLESSTQFENLTAYHITNIENLWAKNSNTL